MRFQFDTGTDIATVALWDPEVTGEELGSKVPFRELNAWAEAHGALLVQTGADGSYLVEVVVGEPLPEEFAKCEVGGTVGLRIPSGVLRGDGLEMVGKPGDTAAIEPGDYDAELRVPDFEADVERAWEQELTEAQQASIEAEGNVACMGLLGVPFSIALAILWTPWSLLATLPLLAMTIAVAIKRSSGPEAAQAKEQWEAIQRRFPSLIVMLTPRHGEPAVGGMIDAG